MAGPYVILEGVVKTIREASLWFREDGAEHDINIPLSQVRDADGVQEGDPQIEVTAWILRKLDDGGKR